MATVRTVLAMHDQMTSVLKGITSSLYLTLSAMEDMQKSTEKTFDSKKVNAARAAIQQTEAAIKMLPPPIEDAVNKQEKFNKRLQQGEGFASGLVKKVVGIAAAYVGFRQIKGFLEDSLGVANEQIRAEQRLQTIMANINGMTQDGINLVKQQAYELERLTSISSAVGIFGQSQLAQYVYDPNNINALSEAMYNLATETYGVNVTQEQISQTADLIGKAMMGQIDALSRNGFKLSAILEEAEIELFKYGNEAERTAILVEVLNENQEELARAMRHTPEGSIHALHNAYAGVQTIIGYGLIPTILMFTDLIETNMPLIQDIFTYVFYYIFSLMDQLIQYGSMVANFFINNWSWLEPLVWGFAGSLAAIIPIITVLAAKQLIWNTIMKANPIYLIISLVTGLIGYLIRLWQTNDAFAAGFMRAWNGILNLISHIPAYFWQLVEWMLTPFEWWAQSIGKIYDAVINGIIEGINKVLEIVNKVTGSSYEIQAKFSFENIAKGMKEYAQIQKETAYANAAIKAAEREQKVLDMLDSRAANRAAAELAKEERFKAPELYGAGALGSGMWDVGDNFNINKVNEVGKIRDTVDISSEDLRLMRELAEMRNIQNFVTLTPTVSVLHTGDVNSGYDIETITERITERLETEIASSARGVFGV